MEGDITANSASFSHTHSTNSSVWSPFSSRKTPVGIPTSMHGCHQYKEKLYPGKLRRHIGNMTIVRRIPRCIPPPPFRGPNINRETMQLWLHRNLHRYSPNCIEVRSHFIISPLLRVIRHVTSQPRQNPMPTTKFHNCLSTKYPGNKDKTRSCMVVPYNPIYPCIPNHHPRYQ